jgi:hypothetical protein
MIFATGGQLYSSTDGGATRVRVTPTQLQTYNHGGVSRVEFSRDGTVVYAADFQSVYRSDDFGASWTADCRSGGPKPCARENGVEHQNHERWRRSLGLLDAAGERGVWLCVRCLRDYLGRNGQWAVVHDRFRGTWTLSPLTGDIREVGIDPRDPSLVYAQADGFVYRSSDGGAHFTRATGTGGVWSPHTTAF